MMSLLLFLFSAFTCLEANDPHNYQVAHLNSKILGNWFGFCVDLFKALGKGKSMENVIISPSSVYRGMLSMYVASAGSTQKSLEKILRLQESPDRSTLLLIDSNLTVPIPKLYELDFVDRIFIGGDQVVKPAMASLFGDKLGVFKTVADHEAEVNEWVDKTTKGRIRDILPNGSLPSESQIVFVNAAYLSAAWWQPFATYTYTKQFILNDGSIKLTHFIHCAPYPRNFFKSKYLDELQANIISLPYTGPGLEMVVILPSTLPKKGTPPPILNVLKKLSHFTIYSIISYHLRDVEPCATSLMIPKFKLEVQYDLRNAISDIGESRIFDHNMDLSDLFEPGQRTHVGSVAHKAVVDVNQYGTWAARGDELRLRETHNSSLVDEAATPTPPSCVATFHAQSPFIYFIVDTTNNIIHFAGIYNVPKNVAE